MASKKMKLPGVQESQRFLNFEATFRKAGLIILLGIISLALLGTFSGGYLSKTTTANTKDSVVLNYERFGRLQTKFTLKISAQTSDAAKYIFRIGGDFISYYETENIWPQPDSMYSHGDELYLVYDSVKNQHDVSVWLLVTPVKPGWTANIIQLNTEPEIHFRQFIYP